MPSSDAPLLAALRGLAAADTAPFHMPGHHRAAAALPPDLPYALDITELPGFDDLHHPRGVLRDSMERAAALWGSDAAYYCVNGSTGALLAGVRALTRQGDAVLVARNCHASVFHAVELCGLHPHWLEPAWLPTAGLCGSLEPETLRAAMVNCPAATLCIVTSPTYEGVLSDIAALAKCAHAGGIPLLVDEAHGAHLGYCGGCGFPESAVRLGADLVVQSLHKTLPALTQTAVLHRCGGRVDPARLEHQLAVFQTSSPSYPLLASMDWLVSQPENWRRRCMTAWREQLRQVRAQCAGLLALEDAQVDGTACFALDPSKLVLDARRFGLTAEALATRLRSRKIEPEYALGHVVLLMTAPLDPPTQTAHLFDVLPEPLREDHLMGSVVSTYRLPLLGVQALPLAKAMEQPAKSMPFAAAQGRICAEYVWAYPPGIPLLVPGQQVTAAFLAAVAALTEAGGELRSTHGKAGAIVCAGEEL
ncbi:MAG: DegT/DnrJ/EryC1/StrS family aminotransferase [Oscillospiraceae bacterium]|jgi:arginine/lysine/ornithine decarboxylase|nr:DegT/DnrJ/EryC1/StrS family aminotransferase [Oscillospiraceae bacterium]